MKLKTVVISLVILTAAMALTVGCIGMANGGGMFIDQNGHKVTFGFNAKAIDDETFKGQFQLVDHETGQKIHVSEMQGVFMGPYEFGDVHVGPNEAWFGGLDDDEVPVLVNVIDNGEPGPDEGDYIAVYYDDDMYDEPSWSGYLVKGNIQIHKDK